ncbi:MAG: SPOR domain-containing protein [Burkholderiales bacterium]|jgi:cell division protein FtsN|nr:SPOR domain-containing protein [Burkholderiales bacterium]
MQEPVSNQRGGMLLGFVFGLVVGLAIAVAVALFISNAPLPFVTKVRPPSANQALPADGKLPDPNANLNLAPPPPPPQPPAAGKPPAAAVAPPGKAEAAAVAPGGAVKQEAMAEGSRFLLQAGAFKSAEDADGMRAQLALMGLDARIFPIEQGGQTLYRVRLGPYGQLDDVNRVRKLLADNGIEGQLVRLR